LIQRSRIQSGQHYIDFRVTRWGWRPWVNHWPNQPRREKRCLNGGQYSPGGGPPYRRRRTPTPEATFLLYRLAFMRRPEALRRCAPTSGAQLQRPKSGGGELLLQGLELCVDFGCLGRILDVLAQVVGRDRGSVPIVWPTDVATDGLALIFGGSKGHLALEGCKFIVHAARLEGLELGLQRGFRERGADLGSSFGFGFDLCHPVGHTFERVERRRRVDVGERLVDRSLGFC